MHRISLLLFCLLIAPSAWGQQSAVDEYWAARERGEAALTQKFGSCADAKPDFKMDEYNAEAERLNGELEPLMRRVIGRATPPAPFSGDGSFAPGLGCGLGMDALDGIRLWAEGSGGADGSSMVLTTAGLLRRWLQRNEPNHPQWQANLDAAFRSGDLNTEMIDAEAWREAFAILPIDKPAGLDAAFAVLGESGNGSLIWPPQMISFYVRKGDRIFLADLALATRFAPLEACGDPNKPTWSEENLARYNNCWKQRGDKEPAFADAVRQAQAFVDALAAVQFSP